MSAVVGGDHLPEPDCRAGTEGGPGPPCLLPVRPAGRAGRPLLSGALWAPQLQKALPLLWLQEPRQRHPPMVLRVERQPAELGILRPATVPSSAPDPTSPAGTPWAPGAPLTLPFSTAGASGHNPDLASTRDPGYLERRGHKVGAGGRRARVAGTAHSSDHSWLSLSPEWTQPQALALCRSEAPRSCSLT